MSGVRNLRAMFEQKGDKIETSPPDRGRSPGIPPTIASSSVDGESPRPLSKVRTSFIAIEKDGRIGLQRDNSQDSNISATRRISGESNMASPTPSSRQGSDTLNVFADAMGRAAPKMTLQDQPIPESPRTESSFQAALASLSPAKSDVAATTPRKFRVAGLDKPLGSDKPIGMDKPLGTDKPLGASKPLGTDKPATSPSVSEPATKPKTEATPTPPAAPTPLVATTSSANGTAAKSKEPATEKTEMPKPVTKMTTAAASLKPISAASASKPVGKPAKSPTVSKAPKSPLEATAPKLTNKTPESAPRQPEKTDSAKPVGSSARSSSIKKPPPLQPSPSGTGFIKPKVKSPTRPVKLPPSLTAPTAASVSKLNPARTTSRTSGSLLTATENHGRAPSRTSVSTAATTKTAGTKTLKRQNSTINRPRPSLGPPPKQAAKDHPPTRKEKEVDEGFLARMMRPTQASQMKTADKAPVSPPRKLAASAVPKKVPAKTETKAEKVPAKAETKTEKLEKVVRKVLPKAVVAAASSSRQHSSAPTQGVAAKAVKPTIAVEAAKPAHVKEEAQIAPTETVAKTVQDVAVVAEKAETAEKIVEVAKKVDGEVALPEPSHDGELSPKSTAPADILVQGVKHMTLEDALGTKQEEAQGPESSLPNGHHENNDDDQTEDSLAVEETNGVEEDPKSDEHPAEEEQAVPAEMTTV